MFCTGQQITGNYTSSLYANDFLHALTRFNLTIDQNTSSSQTAVLDKDFDFYFSNLAIDLALIFTLASLGLMANIGLLCLSRVNKSSIGCQGANSSFSISFTQNLQPSNGGGGLFSSSLNNKQSPMGNYAYFCCLPGCTRIGNESIPAYAIRNNSISYAPPSSLVPVPRYRRRSRCHRRYVRGLTGLAISNLFTSLGLAASALIALLARFYKQMDCQHLFLALLASNVLIDLAQSLELAAILWIALDRMLGLSFRPASTNNQSLRSTLLLGRVSQPILPPTTTRRRNSWMPGQRAPPDKIDQLFAPTRNTRRDSADSGTLWYSCLERRSMSAHIVDDQKKGCLTTLMTNFKTLHRTMMAKKHLTRPLCWLLRFLVTASPIGLFVIGLTTSLHSVSLALINNKANISRLLLTQLASLTGRSPSNHRDSPKPPFWHSSASSEVLLLTSNVYYTRPVVLGLILGHFVLPIGILLLTSLMIHNKVASRDKSLFSRQSSNTSKSSCNSYTSGTNNNNVGQQPTYCRRNRQSSPPVCQQESKSNRLVVPTLCVVGDSQQEAPSDSSDTLSSGDSNEDIGGGAGNHLLAVPKLETTELDAVNGRSVYPGKVPMRYARRCSEAVISTGSISSQQPTPLLPSPRDTEFNSSGLMRAACDADSQPAKLARLKSINDLRFSLQNTFRSKLINGRGPLSPSTGNGPLTMGTEEPVLVQLLRRQHRRTLRILVILLLVFILCRAPRTLLLAIGWFQSSCPTFTLFFTHLRYATLWSSTSTVLDTIVYGFWGNRAYRLVMQRWFASCTNRCGGRHYHHYQQPVVRKFS